jgi:predicted DNA-binding mobile mystery protein A
MNSKIKTTELVRRQLDQRFRQIPRELLRAPSEGWIKTLRKSLGMSGPQLAKRLNITKASLAEIESSEKNFTITLSTLKKVADVLDCEVFVTLIPRTSLQATLEKRAAAVAKKMVQRNLTQMELEAQSTSKNFQEKQVLELSKELVENLNRRIWEEP